MKRLAIIPLLLLCILTSSCTILGGRGNSVEVRKPRLHKTWPKKHKWHKKLRIWKFTIQMPERGGAKKVRMKG